MPTRWMRWNETSHIFEYSTDGVAFGVLPLDASILTQGTIDPARLPEGGSGGVDPTVPVDWTGQQTYSGVAPRLRFTETDQGANLKNWDIGVDAALFQVRTLNDALAGPVTLVGLTRAGVLTLSAPGAVIHGINANVDGADVVNFSNPHAGSGAHAGLTFQNNVGASRGAVVFTSAAFALAGYIADALNLIGAGAGGVNINAKTGALLLKTADVTRLTIAADGVVTFAGGIIERGRTIPQGEWIDIPYSAGLFTAATGTWTVTVGNFVNFQYTIIGKTAIVTITLNATSWSASTTGLFAAVPAVITPAVEARCGTHGTVVNAWRPMSIGVNVGLPRLSFVNADGTQMGITTNFGWIGGMISYEIQ